MWTFSQYVIRQFSTSFHQSTVRRSKMRGCFPRFTLFSFSRWTTAGTPRSMPRAFPTWSTMPPTTMSLRSSMIVRWLTLQKIFSLCFKETVRSMPKKDEPSYVDVFCKTAANPGSSQLGLGEGASKPDCILNRHPQVLQLHIQKHQIIPLFWSSIGFPFSHVLGPF